MKILVAEDNDDNLDLMSRYLVRRGHEVVAARSGRAAVELALSCSPDLVLMDVALPEISGLDAARRIRSEKRTASLPIIAVTAHALDGDRARCLEAGCDAYVSKPIDFAALDALLRSVGAGGAR